MTHSTPKRRAKDARAELSEASGAQRRESLYLCLASIPAGSVVSYGQLAELAGAKGAARWAARTLSQLPEGTTLPWHRVITACGRPGLSPACPAGEEQRQRLREEGIALTNDRVNMRLHGWHPTLSSE
ncbi:MAG TPA: MGMT family protein [Pseudomonas sp.]|nr:MGMT family protein [Pseudomonas sp.]